MRAAIHPAAHRAQLKALCGGFGRLRTAGGILPRGAGLLVVIPQHAIVVVRKDLLAARDGASDNIHPDALSRMRRCAETDVVLRRNALKVVDDATLIPDEFRVQCEPLCAGQPVGCVEGDVESAHGFLAPVAVAAGGRSSAEFDKGAAWKHPTVRLFPSGSDLAAVGSDDAIWEKPAGVPVSFGVAELLSLAGVSLDSRWSGGGADAQGRTPLHRLSGVILNLRVHFKGQYEQQTYCDLAIEATRTWTSRGWRALRPLQSALGLQADAILSSAIVSTAIVSGAIASTVVGARCLSG